MISLVVMAITSAAPSTAQTRWVAASVAWLRASPDPASAERATLPIGVEVQVLSDRGGFSEVVAVDGSRGFVSSSALGGEPPVLSALLDRWTTTSKPEHLERAAALEPSNLDVIERFAAAQTAPERIYLARKGWVAAKRRTLMWDGPLYAVDDGRARFPIECSAHEERPSGPDGMEDGPADEKTRFERRRAFRWVSSGKVVSVSERGYTTEHLRAPRCDGERLAYPVSAKRGALVPSWLVAGFTVTPVRDGVAASARHRVELAVDGSKLTVRSKTFTTTVEASLELSRSAAPVAVFSDSPGTLFVLLQGTPCAERESTVFLVRAAAAAGALTLDEGRPWGCAQSRFTALDGEPRDVSRPALLKDAWKR